eukprot:TRINITY_DN22430_c0_g1_i1.p2 TRINITY_DN22430_c0_g1~~TRINITY_DN22430_c0_g1_i1.p2  ORF type:complete len:382 (+),score=68.11 TRINITY_DN22430_c0_g1_i1:63-1208(+)
MACVVSGHASSRSPSPPVVARRPQYPAPDKRRPCVRARSQASLLTPTSSPRSRAFSPPPRRLNSHDDLEATPAAAAACILYGAPAKAALMLRRSSSRGPACLSRSPSEPSTRAPSTSRSPGGADAGLLLQESFGRSPSKGANSFSVAFEAFCGGARQRMDIAGFVAICKHAFLIGKHFTVADAEAVFTDVAVQGKGVTAVGGTPISLEQFERSLGLVAKRKAISEDAIRRAVTNAQLPIAGVRPVDEPPRRQASREAYTPEKAVSSQEKGRTTAPKVPTIDVFFRALSADANRRAASKAASPKAAEQEPRQMRQRSLSEGAIRRSAPAAPEAPSTPNSAPASPTDAGQAASGEERLRKALDARLLRALSKHGVGAGVTAVQ